MDLCKQNPNQRIDNLTSGEFEKMKATNSKMDL
jgi:hypothetical protein